MSGLHLKPDNSFESATHMPTFQVVFLGFHVCVLIRNFSSTYVEMSSTGLRIVWAPWVGDEFGVIAWQ